MRKLQKKSCNVAEVFVHEVLVEKLTLLHQVLGEAASADVEVAKRGTEVPAWISGEGGNMKQ